MDRKVNVIEDLDGRKTVFIHDIRFKGKDIVWDDVEKYLRQYVGEFYNIADDGEIVFINKILSFAVDGNPLPLDSGRSLENR